MSDEKLFYARVTPNSLYLNGYEDYDENGRYEAGLINLTLGVYGVFHSFKKKRIIIKKFNNGDDRFLDNLISTVRDLSEDDKSVFFNAIEEFKDIDKINEVEK